MKHAVMDGDLSDELGGASILPVVKRPVILKSMLFFKWKSSA
jgi:hypothetical protein